MSGSDGSTARRQVPQPPPAIKKKEGSTTIGGGSGASRSRVLGTSYSSQSRRGGSRATTTAASQASPPGKNSKPPLQLLDAEGRDVTPRSLIDPSKRPTADDVGRKLSHDTPAFAERSMMWGASQEAHRTVVGDGGGTAAFPTNFTGASYHASIFSIGSANSVAEDYGEEVAPSLVTGLADVQTLRKALEREELSDADLNKQVSIHLSETDTISIFDLPSTWVAPDTEEAAAVAAENERRKALEERLKRSREGLVDHGTQTINNAQKDRDVQVTGPVYVETACEASTHDLSDTFEALAALPVTATDNALGRAVRAFRGHTDDGHSRASVTTIHRDPLPPQADMRLRELGFGVQRISHSSEALSAPSPDAQFASVSATTTFSDACRLCERLVAHNLRHVAQLQYLCYPDVPVPITPPTTDPCLKTLWTYTCGLTDGRVVTALSFNRKNSDILAVGYGSLDLGSTGGGLVCCWSIKNPEYPERVYVTPSPVASLDFATVRPSLLAVGLNDGNVCVYDILSPELKPLLDSTDKDTSLKHAHPVWDLKWVVRERMIGEERAELLFTVSSDGRVLQWSLHRGLDQTEVMLAKRTTREGQGGTELRHKGNAKAAFMARLAGIMSIDFLPEDHNIYLIGTEDGNIHRCSCSYNEQFLYTHSGHTGAIYKMAWNPHAPGVFMTCSADWSVKLWTKDKEHAVCSLQAATAPVLDCAWSPHSASVLASLSANTLHVWDVAVKPMDPLVSVALADDATLTSVAFASSASAIITGDSQGRVGVHLLCNMTLPSPEEQSERLMAALKKAK